jgi:hypothetical protein
MSTNNRQQKPRTRPPKRENKQNGLTIQKEIGFSNSQRVKMRFCEQFTIDPSTGVAQGYIFRANSCFDPNETGTGHQPLGFDQWMAFYDHYTVLENSIKVTCHAPGEGVVGTNAGFLAIVLKDNSSSLTGNLLNVLAEQGRSKTTPFTVAGGNKGVVTLSHRVNIRKFFGRTDIMDNSDLKGNISLNPVEQLYWHILVASADNGANLAKCFLFIEMELDVQFTEPKYLSTS